jgi:periplasmic protein TonB
MPRDLFGDVTRPSISIGNRKWYTVPVSLLSHFAVVAAVVVVPLLATDVLPAPFETIDSFILVKPIVPPPPPLPPERRKIDTAPVDPEVPPTVVPTGINPEPPEILRDPGDNRGESVILGRSDFTDVITPPPLPPPPPQQPLRVGSTIRQPQKIREVAPVYSPIAQAARVQGIVIIEATIGADGHVVNARVLRSVPLLDEAALAAVRQWQYTPTLLNGVPVPVIMTVTVQFTLSK